MGAALPARPLPFRSRGLFVVPEPESNLRAVYAPFRQRRESAAGGYAADGVRQLRIATVLDFIEEVATVQREYPALVVRVKVETGIEYRLVRDKAQVVVGIG